MLSKILEWAMGQKRIIKLHYHLCVRQGKERKRGENEKYGHSTNVKVRGLCRQSL